MGEVFYFNISFFGDSGPVYKSVPVTLQELGLHSQLFYSVCISAPVIMAEGS